MWSLTRKKLLRLHGRLQTSPLAHERSAAALATEAGFYAARPSTFTIDVGSAAFREWAQRERAPVARH
eukprot:6867289-Prymnesium_polylepis.1